MLKGLLVGESLLKVVLYPYSFVVQCFYPIQLVFQEGIGYMATDGSFIINRGCLGHTFMIMVFVVIYFGFYSHKPKGKHLRWMLKCVILAVGLGYVINSIRILASIPFIGFRYFGMIHSGIGTIIYVVTLTILYMLLKYKEGKGEN